MWSPSSASLRVELRAGTLEGASVCFFCLSLAKLLFVLIHRIGISLTEQAIISVDFLEVIAGKKLHFYATVIYGEIVSMAYFLFKRPHRELNVILFVCLGLSKSIYRYYNQSVTYEAQNITRPL